MWSSMGETSIFPSWDGLQGYGRGVSEPNPWILVKHHFPRRNPNNLGNSCCINAHRINPAHLSPWMGKCREQEWKEWHQRWKCPPCNLNTCGLRRFLAPYILVFLCTILAIQGSQSQSQSQRFWYLRTGRLKYFQVLNLYEKYFSFT